jgi:hypothetical protein
VHDVESIVRLQALLADALLHPDPPSVLRDHAHVDADGLRIAALLVAKLRFQRLMNGSRRAAVWFERDAAGFTDAFRRYHRTVPPTASDPWREAMAFDSWCDEAGAGDP